MYKRTIDNKTTYTDPEGYEAVDLGASIFTTTNIFSGQPMSAITVGESMEMRPDLISHAAYGDDGYTEMILKFNGVLNPFTVKKDDIMLIPSVTYVDRDVTVSDAVKNKTQDALIRNFHKYVDSSKVPSTVGSQKNTSTIPSEAGTLADIKKVTTAYREANLAEEGDTAVKEVNGRLYFGADTGMKCAADGITTAKYLDTVLKSSTKTTE